jgi:hypothetical protein
LGDGRKSCETLHMTSGRSNNPPIIRFLYDIPTQTQL